MMVQLKPKNRSHFSVILCNLRYVVKLSHKYWTKYYKITRTLFEKYELLKDSNAQFNLGFMYRNGYGVEKSIEKAVQWYQKSADQGDADAKVQLNKIATKQL